MSNLLKMMAGAGIAAPLYSDDVFQSYVRTGTGAEATITTNIDMTEGYMLWSKGRSGATDHAVYDSARGVTLDLVTNSTAAQTTQAQGLKSVSATGHTIGTLAKMNTSAATYVDWVFRKAPRFLDIVTYSGNEASYRTLAHSLGVAPGMIIIKKIGGAQNWGVWHRSLGKGGASNEVFNALYLNLTDASTAITWFGDYGASTIPDMTATQFSVGGSLNSAGSTYIAYIFAHDTETDGIIQCGSYTGTGATGNAVTLGFEPQYLLVKRATGGTASWFLVDSMRGFTMGDDNLLFPDSSAAEVPGNYFNPTATGFTVETTSVNVNGNTDSYIYLAIRRPNKPPTVGTQVYNAIARTGTGAAATVTGVGFAPDLHISKQRATGTRNGLFSDRLRGASNRLVPDAIWAEAADAAGVTSFDQDGISVGADGALGAVNISSAYTYINWFFRRAAGFFDEVCYTGNNTARTISHNLTAIPELMIVKTRGANALAWMVYDAASGNTKYSVLNTTAALVTASDKWNNTTPTASVFTVGVSNETNETAYTYVAYLFATLAGISKVGSYTGNGSSQNIEMGFAAGARFFLVKATSTTGSWWVFDVVRGIISGTDFGLQLNSTSAEITTADAVDPYAGGISVVEEATCAINTNGVVYIFLAVA